MRIHPKMFYPLFALAVAVVSSCGNSDDGTAIVQQVNTLDDTSVAVVDGRSVSLSLLEVVSLALAQREVTALSTEDRSRLIDELVTMYLLADDADRLNLATSPSVAAELEYRRLQFLARTATEHFREQNRPTESELRKAYEENLPRFLATQHKASHILVPIEEQAIQIIAELDAGGDFAELAREHSTGPTGPSGGDLGWFTADSMVTPFADAVRAAQIGAHTPRPVQTQFGWHVILVEDIKEQQAPGLEAVRDEIVVIVERNKLSEHIKSLHDAAEIEVQ